LAAVVPGVTLEVLDEGAEVSPVKGAAVVETGAATTGVAGAEGVVTFGVVVTTGAGVVESDVPAGAMFTVAASAAPTA
jgi:hypothetical protein